MSLDQVAITQQHEQLAVHRRRLAHLFQQQAILGAYTPPYVALDIEQTQANIRSIKALLREHSVPVKDDPDDERPVQVSTPLSPALHQLRAPVGDFVGREREIDQLVQTLSKAADTGTVAAISGIRGLGGIGKTELAHTVAHRLKDVFPDAQLLIELRGASSSSLTPEDAVRQAIYAFERHSTLPDDLPQLQALYRAQLSGKRVLILADDAKDAAQVRSLLPPVRCALLVTSRNRFNLPGMAAIDLGMLPPEKADELLLTICPRIGIHAWKLASLCGYLPLALRVSASLLDVNYDRDVGRYVEQLRVERMRHLKDSDDPSNPQASVEASLKLSYDGLDEPTRSVLCQLSVFATRFNETAVNRVIRIKGDTEAALELLQRRYLLERDSTTGMYNLHDLVREFGFSQLRNRNSVYQRARVWYNEVAHSTSEEAAAILRLLTSEELHRFTTRRRQIKEFLAQEDRRQSKQGSSGANRSNDET